MANKITYRVTGRYMSGSEVVMYHLLGSNGSEMRVTKDKAILMISRGDIENMRVQYSNDDVIIRGKGVNLNTLPIYDMNKDKFRANNKPQMGTTTKTAKQNPMSQIRITKRIMFKTTCVGYVVEDTTGKESKINKDNALQLAAKGMIINASASRYTPAGQSNPVMVLRGINCELKSLPTIMVDKAGNEIKSENTQGVIVRATRVKKSGILYNESKHTRDTFNSGDYIIVMPSGELRVLGANKAASITSASPAEQAYAATPKDVPYSIEFLGSKKNPLSIQIVQKWATMKISNKAG